ncbi:hypothetical protein MT899_004772 [Salmonella enterica subsp. enterica]|nr:hypothetical protein [Salmonella enterica subsp. enterica]EJB3514577.1 hypothetical protein [Salmonella enterica subsp. enterica]
MAVLEVMEDEVEMAGTRLQDITEVMVVKVETAVVRVMVGEEVMVDMDNPPQQHHRVELIKIEP